LYAERRFELRKGASFPIYMIVYGTIRFLTELLRTDTTFRFLGLSRNAYVSLAAILGGAILLYLIQTRGSPRERANTPEAVDS
jgi:prolipoprotein diacylglyceryltransferase